MTAEDILGLSPVVMVKEEEFFFDVTADFRNEKNKLKRLLKKQQLAADSIKKIIAAYEEERTPIIINVGFLAYEKYPEDLTEEEAEKYEGDAGIAVFRFRVHPSSTIERIVDDLFETARYQSLKGRWFGFQAEREELELYLLAPGQKDYNKGLQIFDRGDIVMIDKTMSIEKAMKGVGEYEDDLFY